MPFFRRNVVLVLLALTGCAGPNIAQHQASCEERHPDFESMVTCLTAQLANDPHARGRDSDLVQLYVAAANVLALKVKSGQLSESDARLKLTKLYMQLRSESKRRTGQALQGLGQALQNASAAMRQSQTTNYPRTSCICTCVNGKPQALCTSSLDLPPICPPRVCPITPPSVAPILTPQLPPLGTTRCDNKQVLNPDTNRYEWRRVCE